MSRIHPAGEKQKCGNLLKKESPSVLTVWKRSSMSFQGTDGFTVFDEHGRLAFRVDNYSRKNQCFTGTGGGLVLMDGAGKPLLTLKPQIFSMQYEWNGYRGEDGCGISQVFSMRRRRSLLLLHRRSEDEAQVFMGGGSGGVSGGGGSSSPDFRISGSFRTRNCKIRSATGDLVAKISRKKVNSSILLSDDVFSLLIQPGFDSHLIMSFLIILDRICAKPFLPAFCS